MAVELKKFRIEYNKPIYIEGASLKISKIIVYEFHYDFHLMNISSCIQTATALNMKYNVMMRMKT